MKKCTYCLLLNLLVAIGVYSPHVLADGDYHNDFIGAIGPEWQIPSADNPGDGQLGSFGGHESATLTLRSLANHQEVSLKIAIELTGSWDGNSSTYGPDYFRIQVVGGPTLLDKVFGAGRHDFDFTFPHASSSLTLKFVSANTDNPGERWAITDISVVTKPTNQTDINGNAIVGKWCRKADPRACMNIVQTGSNLFKGTTTGLTRPRGYWDLTYTGKDDYEYEGSQTSENAPQYIRIEVTVDADVLTLLSHNSGSTYTWVRRIAEKPKVVSVKIVRSEETDRDLEEVLLGDAFVVKVTIEEAPKVNCPSVTVRNTTSGESIVVPTLQEWGAVEKSDMIKCFSWPIEVVPTVVQP